MYVVLYDHLLLNAVTLGDKLPQVERTHLNAHRERRKKGALHFPWLWLTSTVDTTAVTALFSQSAVQMMVFKQVTV